MFSPTKPPIKLYGPGILTLPVGVFTARNQGEQVQALTHAFEKSNPAKLKRMLKKFFGF